ncbi:MAG: translation initiation factor IF-2 N-terminal domain-containing protein [Gallintestinimicrobium sp.]
MAKIKVHELAKELEIKSKDVITFLQEKGVDVKAAQSSIEGDAVEWVKKKFAAANKGAVRSKGQRQDRAGSADRKEGAGGESGNGRKDDADCGSTG